MPKAAPDYPGILSAAKRIAAEERAAGTQGHKLPCLLYYTGYWERTAAGGAQVKADAPACTCGVGVFDREDD